MEIRPINIKEIKRVLAHIEENVKRLQMNEWCIIKTEKNHTLFREEFFPECGTLACFAGWTVALNLDPSEFIKLFDELGYPFRANVIEETAQEILGLTSSEAREIFMGQSLCFFEPAEQLEQLKRDINFVLAARCYQERV